MRYVVREDNRVGMLHKLCFEEGGILCRGHCVYDSECEEGEALVWEGGEEDWGLGWG